MNNSIRWTDTNVTMECISKRTFNHANDGDLALTRDGKSKLLCNLVHHFLDLNFIII